MVFRQSVQLFFKIASRAIMVLHAFDAQFKHASFCFMHMYLRYYRNEGIFLPWTIQTLSNARKQVVNNRWSSSDARNCEFNCQAFFQGQCFIALSPGAFCPGFEARMQDLIDTQRALNPTEPDKPVVVAGDPERNHIKKCEELGGIPYPRNVVEYMVKHAAPFEVLLRRVKLRCVKSTLIYWCLYAKSNFTDEKCLLTIVHSVTT